MSRLNRRRWIQLTAAGTALALGARAMAESKYGIEGQLAPALRVPHWIDGQGRPMTFDRSELEGRWQLLKFFQSWCPGCHSRGFPTVKAIHEAFADQPQLRVLAVQTTFEGFSTNTRDRLTEIQDRYDLRIPFGHDAGDPHGDRLPRTMREYRSGGTPWIVVVAPNRHVIFNDYHLDASSFIDWLKPKLNV